MKKILLLVLFSTLGLAYLSAQISDDCANANASGITFVDGVPNVVPVAGFTDDLTQSPTDCPLALDVDFFVPFQVAMDGAYLIMASNANPVGNFCLEIGTNCADLDPLIPGECQIFYAGNTYLLGVYFETGGEGDITLTLVNNSAPNDECAMPTPITGNLLGETNECATNNEMLTCNPNQVSTVWYQYIVPPGMAQIEFQVDPESMGGLPIFGILQSDCNTYFNGTAADSESCTGAPLIVECPTAGDIINMFVASDVGSEGVFNIFLTETPQDPACTMNDDCSMPTVLNLSPIPCMLTEFPGCNIDACPELTWNFAGCPWDTSPTVFYEITTDPGAVSLDIEVVAGSLTDPVWALIEPSSCTSGTVTSLTPSLCENMLMEEVAIMGGNTYLIAVGSASDSEGSYEINIVQNIPPEGDDPCPTDDTNPNDDLVDFGTAGGSFSGTTCCATMDFTNLDCGAATETNSSWFLFQPDINQDGTEIIVNTGTATGLSVEVYQGPASFGCNGGAVTVFGSECSVAGMAEFNVPTCDGDPPFIWVKIGTSEANCGTYSISIVNAPDCGLADECMEVNQIFMPFTDPSGGVPMQECVQGCIDYACPETLTDCGFNNLPVVWFQVNTDADAAQLFVNIQTPGTWDPVFAVYLGPCTNLQLVSTGNTPPCNTQWNDPSQIFQPVNTTETYYIAVAADGFIDDPTFTICVYTTVELVSCIGDTGAPDYLVDCAPDANFAVITRSNDPDGSLGLPLEGPYCPGETIEVCVDFMYNALGTGIDWLQGVVPIYGVGWDETLLDFPNANITGNGQSPQWFNDFDVNTNEPLSFVCTYTDSEGNFQICSGQCTPCPDCTNGLGMVPNDPLPGGWYWLANGGLGCANNGNPNTMYGIGSTTANVILCLDLTIEEFNSEAECLAEGDLKFGFQTFSDGISGCWEDPQAECALDVSQFVNFPLVCQFPPGVVGDGIDPNPPVEICSGNPVNAVFMTDDNSATLIELEYDVANNNPNITGWTPGVQSFPTGSGTINDVLVNLTNMAIDVTYILNTDDGGPCVGPSTELIVTVFPEIPNVPEMYNTCDNGDAILVGVNPTGGSGNYVSFDWSNGETTQQWMFDPTDPSVQPGIINLTVLVTDSNGCQGTIDVLIEIHPAVNFFFLGVQTQYCIETDPALCNAVINLPNLSGTGPYQADWAVVPNGLDWQEQFPNQNFEFDLCTSLAGTYDITLDVTDSNGCVNQQTLQIQVGDIPDITLTPVNIPCDDGSGNQTYQIDVTSNGFVPYQLELIDPMGNVNAVTTINFGTTPFFVMGPGIWTFNVTDINLGCLSTETINISPPLGTPIQTSGDVEICVGDSFMLCVTNDTDYTSFSWSDSGGSTGNCISTDTTMMTTTYVVTATDAAGCGSTASFVVTVNDLPTAQIGGSNTFCPGTSTELTGSGGTSFSWQVANVQVGTDPTYLVNTNNTTVVLVVTDDNGCTASDQITVMQSASLNPNIIGAPVCDMEVVDLDAGVFTTYLWTDMPNGMGNVLGNSQILPGVGAGTYYLSVTDNGCDGSDEFEVIQNTTPTANISMGFACNIDTGNGPTTLDLTTLVSNSAGGTFFDDNGVAIAPGDLVYDFAGPVQQYIFTYMTNTAVAPCMDQTYDLIIDVESCDCPPVNVTPDDLFCSNDASVDLANYELTGDGSWFLNGDPVINELFDPSIGAGVYDLVFILDNPVGGNCDPNDTTVITVSQELVIDIDPDMVDVCNAGMTTTLNLDDYVPMGATGSWTEAGMMVSGVQDYLDEMAGTVHIYEFTTNNAPDPCPQVSDQLVVTIEDCNCPNPLLTDPLVCSEDGTFDVNTTIGDTGVPGFWTDEDGNTLPSNVINIASFTAGNYNYFFVVDPPPPGSSCNPYPLVIQVENPAMAVLDMGPHTLCNTSDAGNPFPNELDFSTLILSGDTSGVWNDDDGTGLDPNAGPQDFSVLGIGTYSFTYTLSSMNPCPDVPYTISVNVIDCACPNPGLQNPASVCSTDGTIDLDGTISNPAATGFWADVDGNPISNIVDVSTLGAGIWPYLYILDPAPPMGCLDQFDLSLDVVDPNFPGDPNPPLRICEGDIELVQLPQQLMNADAGGVWQGDLANVYTQGTNPFDANGNTFDPTSQLAGTYLFTYGWYGLAPCPDVWSTVTVIIDPNPNADAGDGDELNCDNSTTGIVLDGTNSTGLNITYQWVETLNGANIVNPNDPIITVTEPGIYQLDIMDENGCLDSDSAEVTSDDNLPTLEAFSTSPICVGDPAGSITIDNVSGGLAPFEFSIDGGITWVTDQFFSDLSAGVYEVVLRDDNNCLSTTILTITEPSDPIIMLEDDVTVQVNEDYLLTDFDLNINPEDVGNVIWTADGEEIYNGPYLDSILVNPGIGNVEYCIEITDVGVVLLMIA